MTVEEMEVSSENDSVSEKKEKDTETLSLEDLKDQIRLVERSVTTKESRFVLRVLRSLPSTRKKLTANILRKIISMYYSRPENKQDKEQILQFIEEPMETDGTAPEKTEKDLLMLKVSSMTRRSLDLLAARCYYYHTRAYEINKKMEEIRSFLHQRLCHATLKKDHEGQAVLINCLLRNYLHYSLYDQAQKLIVKLEFPQQSNNNELARYHYYMGRIKGVQLEYSEAHKHLIQALRKAPQQTAVGFRQAVQKLAVVVELLLGDIPERQIFRQAIMRRALAPYLELTQAVRLGNLQHFTSVLEQHKSKFQEDHTFMLILRLRHNVIKTGLRSDFFVVLENFFGRCGSEVDVGVERRCRAVINHEKGYMQSKETVDVYCTREPQSVFHQRISFCLNIHNQSVKAMRYPPKERREREQQDLELAKEMAEEDDDGFP
ncbi:putative 26S proteasome non-ATPase regulatory subunit 3 [Armadillidium nasatum]|uniref:Putative 26S proteasome non-ATPase regulatory subunit 3 n=1 Tax=Armadillidium nasatum TaxID=96803 RepID=A0A5N5STI7_9CRUS|nr:putative 26S proteasome non-ATPase regulatory subunit 3 [Armadillidium nasatum]